MTMQSWGSDSRAAKDHLFPASGPLRPPSPRATTLEDAILDATHNRLQSLLLQLVKDCPASRNLVSRALFLPSTTSSPRAGPTMPLRDMSVSSVLNAAGVDKLNSADKQSLSDTHEGTLNTNSSSTLTSARSGTKRKAFEVCRQCEQEYSVAENGCASCCFHPGK